MSYNYATDRGRIVPLTGNYTLKISDCGYLFRNDAASDITVTVPSHLTDGWNASFVNWASGKIIIASASHAINRSAKSALNTQYQAGSLIVIKQAPLADTDAEYMLFGDFA